MRGKRFMTIDIRFKLCSPAVEINGALRLHQVVTQANKNFAICQVKFFLPLGRDFYWSSNQVMQAEGLNQTIRRFLLCYLRHYL